MIQIFTCENCHYTFGGFCVPSSCPDCGSHQVREADRDEIDWHTDLQREKAENPLLQRLFSGSPANQGDQYETCP